MRVIDEIHVSFLFSLIYINVYAAGLLVSLSTPPGQQSIDPI
jgi:hypothetical protein